MISLAHFMEMQEIYKLEIRDQKDWSKINTNIIFWSKQQFLKNKRCFTFWTLTFWVLNEVGPDKSRLLDGIFSGYHFSSYYWDLFFRGMGNPIKAHLWLGLNSNSFLYGQKLSFSNMIMNYNYNTGFLPGVHLYLNFLLSICLESRFNCAQFRFINIYSWSIRQYFEPRVSDTALGTPVLNVYRRSCVGVLYEVGCRFHWLR